MKDLLFSIFIILFLPLVFLFGLSNTSFAGNVEDKTISFFYGNGCGHCTLVDNYFMKESFYEIYPIEKYEIYFNKDNSVLFNELMDRYNIPIEERGIPTVVIGDKVLVGDTPIISNFENLADEYIKGEVEVDYDKNVEAQEKKELVDLTVLVVIGASIVDAINPCAFAVLIILMTTILVSGSGKKALKAGLAFAASIFISYFLMGLGLYKVLGISGITNTFYKIVGWLAILFGLMNLKDWLWYGKGFLMEVPQSWRPRLKNIIGSVTTPIGAFFIGFVISLFLLPCTSGPYIIILGMLAEKVYQTQAIWYLIIYNLVFVTPMIIITLIVYKGFDPNKAEEIRQKRLRALHLIAGIIMIAMGIVILVGWL
ncbi:cytochrome c biogenesis protein [Patescibacteria group bacterium]